MIYGNETVINSTTQTTRAITKRVVFGPASPTLLNQTLWDFLFYGEANLQGSAEETECIFSYYQLKKTEVI